MEGNDPNGSKHLDSHLLPLSHVEAMTRVQAIHSSNNEAVTGLESSISIAKIGQKIKNNFNDYESIKDLSEAVASLHGMHFFIFIIIIIISNTIFINRYYATKYTINIYYNGKKR